MNKLIKVGIEGTHIVMVYIHDALLLGRVGHHYYPSYF